MKMLAGKWSRCGRSLAVRPSPVTGLVLSVLLLALAVGTQAQTLSGIGGTVTDPSGAVVSDAKVTARNNATGVVSTAITSSAGTYFITDLIPGTYTVTIEKAGFEKSLLNDVVVEPGGKRSSGDAILKTGNILETVEVTAPAVTLETSQPELGATIEHKVVEELPDQVGGVLGGVGPRGRQIDDFLFLTPGVQGGEFSHRINGGVDFQNEVVFNGVSAVQSETKGFQSNINPPFEMVNEFRVLSSVFSAQYGLAQGVASYQFASGTNALHGDAFEIMRNDFFDARGAFPSGSTISPSGRVISPRPTDKEHNFGFSLGGPLWLPHIYNGKDKTFWHASIEWYRLNQTDQGTMTVPTAAQKGGDFSGFGQPIYAPVNFVPPAGCPLVAGQPVPGNIIPTSCFSPIAASLVPLIPNPRLPGLTNNLTSLVGALKTRQTSGGFTVDHNLTQSQSLHFAYWRDKYSFPACCDNSAHFNNELSGLKNEPRLGTGVFLTYSNSLSNHLIMTAGAGWLGELNNEFNAHQGVHFPAVAGSTVLPTIAFTGPTSLNPTTWGVNSAGETFSLNRKLGLSFANNWLYTRGRHTINTGWEVRRAYQDDQECQHCGGRFEFNSITTSDGSNFSGTGSAFASFLFGDADAAFRQFAAESRLRNFYFAPYIQDNIKVTPKLTIDAGLRWDILRPFTENHDNVVFFTPLVPNPGAISPATGQPLLGAATKLGTCSGCAGFHHADTQWNHLSPRFGFDYKLNDKTVILGGYAINTLEGGAFEFGDNKVAVNYGELLNGIFQVTSTGNATPNYGSWDSRAIPLPGLAPFAPTLANGTGSLHEFSKNKAVAPYLQAWNFGVQREMPWNMFLSVAYVGNRSIHLPSMLNPVNQINAAYLARFCASGMPTDTACLLSPSNPNGGNAWTNPAQQAALASLGFGQAPCTVSGCPSSGMAFTPYVNFVNDYGSGASLTQALLPYPMYNPSLSCGGLCNNFDMNGTAFYNALQVQAQKRFTNSLSFLVAYTLSRTMSNTDTGFATFNFGSLNKFNQKPEWSVAGNDQTHLLSISSVYELPIGPGKKMFNHDNAATRLLLGGWQVSQVAQYASGTPQTIFSFSFDPFGNGFNRANLVSGQALHVNYKNYYRALGATSTAPDIFNVAAFSDPGYAMGNSPREIGGIRSAFNLNENVALAKHFRITERVDAELRMEYFNVFNRMQICTPDTTVSDGPGRFGVVSPNGLGGSNPCQVNRPRQGQAYFRVSF